MVGLALSVRDTATIIPDSVPTTAMSQLAGQHSDEHYKNEMGVGIYTATGENTSIPLYLNSYQSLRPSLRS